MTTAASNIIAAGLESYPTAAFGQLKTIYNNYKDT